MVVPNSVRKVESLMSFMSLRMPMMQSAFFFCVFLVVFL